MHKLFHPPLLNILDWGDTVTDEGPSLSRVESKTEQGPLLERLSTKPQRSWTFLPDKCEAEGRLWWRRISECYLRSGASRPGRMKPWLPGNGRAGEYRAISKPKGGKHKLLRSCLGMRSAVMVRGRKEEEIQWLKLQSVELSRARAGRQECPVDANVQPSHGETLFWMWPCVSLLTTSWPEVFTLGRHSSAQSDLPHRPQPQVPWASLRRSLYSGARKAYFSLALVLIAIELGPWTALVWDCLLECLMIFFHSEYHSSMVCGCWIRYRTMKGGTRAMELAII